jgi:hypothetical protein
MDGDKDTDGDEETDKHRDEETDQDREEDTVTVIEDNGGSGPQSRAW